jgi:hypothetical protein
MLLVFLVILIRQLVSSHLNSEITRYLGHELVMLLLLRHLLILLIRILNSGLLLRLLIVVALVCLDASNSVHISPVLSILLRKLRVWLILSVRSWLQPLHVLLVLTLLCCLVWLSFSWATKDSPVIIRRLLLLILLDLLRLLILWLGVRYRRLIILLLLLWLLRLFGVCSTEDCPLIIICISLLILLVIALIILCAVVLIVIVILLPLLLLVVFVIILLLVVAIVVLLCFGFRYRLPSHVVRIGETFVVKCWRSLLLNWLFPVKIVDIETVIISCCIALCSLCCLAIEGIRVEAVISECLLLVLWLSIWLLLRAISIRLLIAAVLLVVLRLLGAISKVLVVDFVVIYFLLLPIVILVLLKIVIRHFLFLITKQRCTVKRRSDRPNCFSQQETSISGSESSQLWIAL